jgi:ATP-dependent DNA ligase
VKLPIAIPFPPMEAKRAKAIPVGPEWEYEPKWDGFRCLAFRDGDEVELQSKSGQPLTRYFPEVVAALRAVRARQFVLDGELTVPSFDNLLQRIHPAASRVQKLSHEDPANFVLFDFLVDSKGATLVEQPQEERRRKLEAFHSRYLKKDKSFLLSPVTRDLAQAKHWLESPEGKLDGIVAKRIDQPYLSGERAMIKVKNIRTVDCVVGGFRYATGKSVVGSLLLGLYDMKGLLNHVGFTSSIAEADSKSLTKKLEKLVKPPGFTGAAPGGPSRWSTERSAVWEPLKPVLVVEVSYDHVTGHRFRHGTKLLRWRPDKAPEQCTDAQLRR